MPRMSERTDRNGTVINKERREHKVSFVDNVMHEKLADVIVVESYKKHNMENTHGSQPGCCFIF